jgi:DNA-binding SARP family transcriptional activator
MPLLTLDLLGPARISADGQILDLRVRKQLALLAFLALEQQRHRRESLLGLLWPDMPEDDARNNLRGVLAGLRRALGAAEAALIADRQYVQFAPAGDYILDVARFRTLLAAVEAHAHVAVERCEACIAQLAEAAALYRGDFLDGFSLSDSAPFEEWAIVQREQLHQQQLQALDTLAAAHELRGDYTAQCAYARQQLALEPWRETAYAQLMRGLWASGQRAAALEQYELCRRILADELGLEPSPELAILAEQLRGAAAQPAERPSAFSPRAPLAPDIAEPQPDWPEVPEVARMYGRAPELARLERWLVDDRCRLVALLGIGGVGKTTLAAAAASAVSTHFEAVVWRSLLNAPPLDQLLRDVLGQLAPGAPLEMPPDPQEQVGLLLAALRRARCLLILDNLESILRPDEPGTMRPGYEGYALLLSLVAERSQRSCVLLTSRERPQGLELLEEDTPLVRLLRLDGLSADAGAQMLAARGLDAAEDAAGTLVRRYSGNPLALRLVAQTVREVFDGDIRAFLEAEAPIFDDIGAVLDQQVARLSTLERELLTWLAIEREPVGALVLRTNLVSPGPPRATLEAVRALLRRSLVAQSGGGLALQNVVTEYLTDALITQVVREITGELPPSAPSVDEAALNRFYAVGGSDGAEPGQPHTGERARRRRGAGVGCQERRTAPHAARPHGGCAGAGVQRRRPDAGERRYRRGGLSLAVGAARAAAHAARPQPGSACAGVRPDQHGAAREREPRPQGAAMGRAKRADAAHAGGPHRGHPCDGVQSGWPDAGERWQRYLPLPMGRGDRPGAPRAEGSAPALRVSGLRRERTNPHHHWL